MHTSLLLSVLVALISVLVSAGTLHSVPFSDFPDLLSSLQDNLPASETGEGTDESVADAGDAESTEGDEESPAPCCLPYVWQSKVILWNGSQSSLMYSFYDYPGRRVATYTTSPDYGFIAKESGDVLKHIDFYVFNRTNCDHYRQNITMLPTCLPKSSKAIGPFELGPPVYGRRRLNARAWSAFSGPQQQVLTMTDSDCAPVEAAVQVGPRMLTEYFTDVEMYIKYPSVFDLPPVCCRPMTFEFGAEELVKMKLFGRSILSQFGFKQRF